MVAADELSKHKSIFLQKFVWGDFLACAMRVEKEWRNVQNVLFISTTAFVATNAFIGWIYIMTHASSNPHAIRRVTCCRQSTVTERNFRFQCIRPFGIFQDTCVTTRLLTFITQTVKDMKGLLFLKGALCSYLDKYISKNCEGSRMREKNSSEEVKYSAKNWL